MCGYCLWDLRYTVQLYLIYGYALYDTLAFIQHDCRINIKYYITIIPDFVRKSSWYLPEAGGTFCIEQAQKIMGGVKVNPSALWLACGFGQIGPTQPYLGLKYLEPLAYSSYRYLVAQKLFGILRFFGGRCLV
jgi:hypothetical protein